MDSYYVDLYKLFHFDQCQNYQQDNLNDIEENFQEIIFGTIDPVLTIGGNHFIFNINNLKTSIEKFRKGF